MSHSVATWGWWLPYWTAQRNSVLAESSTEQRYICNSKNDDVMAVIIMMIKKNNFEEDY